MQLDEDWVQATEKAGDTSRRSPTERLRPTSSSDSLSPKSRRFLAPEVPTTEMTTITNAHRDMCHWDDMAIGQLKVINLHYCVVSEILLNEPWES